MLKFGDLKAPLFVEENGAMILDPLLRAVDPVHVLETPGSVILESVLKLARPLLQKTLETLVCRNHSGRKLVDFSEASDKIVHKSDVRSIRELYIMARVHLLNGDCWKVQGMSPAKLILRKLLREIISTVRDITCLMYAPLLSRSPVQVIALTVKAFYLNRLLLRVFSPGHSLYSLPLHQLMIHLPWQARSAPVMEFSTEDFESLWRWLRVCQKYHAGSKNDDPAAMLHLRIKRKIEPA